jgi:hypothetical protein
MKSEAEKESRILGGGFSIEIHPDEVKVTSDDSIQGGGRRSTLRMIVLYVIFLLLGVYFFAPLFRGTVRDRLTALTVYVLIFGPALIWGWITGRNDLRCTRENLEVLNFARGKIRQTRVFPRTTVHRIRFGTVALSKYGSGNGLLFQAEGKTVKALTGLESPEAQTILREFERLGFNVEHDVGMPMMVEMALARRKSKLGL